MIRASLASVDAARRLIHREDVRRGVFVLSTNPARLVGQKNPKISPILLSSR
jgi:hypothetical protein